MLELFCRAPEGITIAEGGHLTPIPIDEAAASLSANLLDDAYYELILACGCALRMDQFAGVLLDLR